jgi:cobalamin biosynthesis protein CbiD
MARGATTALQRGWATGACAAAAHAAFTAMLKGRFPDPVSTLSAKTAVEVAIVDHQGDILARVGM